MDKLFIVTKTILGRIFRKPSSWLFHILLPVAISVALVSIFSSSTDTQYYMGLVDLSESESSQALIQEIEDTGKYNIIDMTEDEIEETVSDGDILFGLEIGEDFEQQILDGENPEITLITLSSTEGVIFFQSTIDYEIQNMMDLATGAEYDESTYHDMLDYLDEGAISFETESVEDVALEKVFGSQTVGLYMMVLMMSILMVAFIVLEEKEKGTYNRIKVAPVNAQTYTLANILACILVAAVQILLVISVIKYLLGVELFMSIGMMFFILMAFTLCTVSLGIMITTLTSSAENSTALMSLIISPSCMLAGCFWDFSYMPDFLQKMAYITPQRWVLDAFATAQSGGGLLEILPYLLVVLGFTVIFFLIAVFRTKYGEAK
jgi:ABC-2 type transport system permease protein